MDRRLRSSCRSLAVRYGGGFNRYLRPGALAQLRNSRISARSHRSDLHSQIYLCRTPSPSPASPRSPAALQAQVGGTGGVPCFAARFYGPRCPQRKKLFAANAVLLPTGSAPGLASDAAELAADSFSSDLVVH